MEDVRRAWEARDPELVELVAILAGEPFQEPETPVREGAPTFAGFLEEIRGKAFARKPPDERAHFRIERLKALEDPGAEVRLADRLRLHEVILALWEDGGPFARSCLLSIVARVPLAYGPWRALKRIFKEAEARGDTEVFGALAARFDMALGRGDAEVGQRTLAYLCRRAWRSLRRTAVALPVAYADAAVDVLAGYEEGTNWGATWVARQVFFHEQGVPRRGGKTPFLRNSDLLKDRAFADLWRRSPRPLFSLLERARCDLVRDFAARALKADFRASLREVEPAWVARLVGVGSRSIDEFVVWVLNNVPRFEQAGFRGLGLHEAVLRLFESPSDEARSYAADYARTHARDLPVETLIRLANNSQPAVRKLAADLLQARDPRREVGLEAWGRLLETPMGHELASTALRKHFGASELTPEWFQGRLLSANAHASRFARELLPRVHPRESLGPGFFAGLIEALDDAPPKEWGAASYVLGELARFDLNALDADFLRRLLVNPYTSPQACAWIDEGRLDPRALPVDVFKALAFHPDWEADPWVAALKQGRRWARALEFNEALADRVLGWLKDVRRFSPSADLGFDWLLRLVVRGEPRYHGFASETMIKGFVPADFAPKGAAASSSDAASRGAVDLAGASFLFTGKLATMTRDEAERKVREAKGTVASGVNARLCYLVIGDEGSPLYGQGKKGSKQLKAESLNAAGANIQVVSETAFLKTLAGEARSYGEDDVLAGCRRLWELATAPGAAEAPLARFAIAYLRRHHPDIAPAETDRPVDPGAEVPAAFLTFDLVRPLFSESRKPLRDLALELARWEFARWSPPADELVGLAESPEPEVRQFLARALLADEAPEHRRYRIDPAALTPAAVYRFCESADESARALGMELIRRQPRLRVPEELFRLAESPDRVLRAFVIRALWGLYRDRGITEGWKPAVLPSATIGAAARKAAESAAGRRGEGPPARPDHLPAGSRELWQFLRRTLFEIPPARPEIRGGASSGNGNDNGRPRPLPARRAKLELVEVLRDLALEDPDFARGVLPLLDEFLTSRGASERAACLVAVTRIRHVHPGLRRPGGEASS